MLGTSARVVGMLFAATLLAITLTSCDSSGAPLRTDCAPIGRSDTCAAWHGSTADVKTPVGTLTNADFSLRFTVLNGERTVVVGTPCNTLSMRMTSISPRRLAFSSQVASTAELCTGARVQPEIAIKALFEQPVRVAVSGSIVTLGNSSGFVTITPPG